MTMNGHSPQCPHCIERGVIRHLAPVTTDRGEILRCWECGGEYQDGVRVWPLANVPTEESGPFEPELTPVVDEGLTLRASQLDWSTCKEPAIVQCMERHGFFQSNAKFDLSTEAIISEIGCPVCHSHRMTSVTVPPKDDEP
jgi:hypothetical protein